MEVMLPMRSCHSDGSGLLVISLPDTDAPPTLAGRELSSPARTSPRGRSTSSLLRSQIHPARPTRYELEGREVPLWEGTVVSVRRPRRVTPS
jgi:hypothetical protein